MTRTGGAVRRLLAAGIVAVAVVTDGLVRQPGTFISVSPGFT